MTEFIVFALYICVSIFLLIVAPVMMVPGLPPRRKLLICGISFVVLVPSALLLYAWIGTPQLAAS